MNGVPLAGRRYDVIVAGARCAGAATAMLLARRGLRVLVVDPMRSGSDTLSTHALMPAGVFQLHRWGLLDAIRNAGTPAITTTTFYYGQDNAITLPIKEREGIDALYAPRRTVLDAILLDAAREAGADIALGCSLIDVVRDASGRVTGALVTAADRGSHQVAADLVVGADGMRSRVARAVGAEVTHQAAHATAAIYTYVRGLEFNGFEWFYEPNVSAGAIPTNHGETCVFVSLPPARFERQRKDGLDWLHHEVLCDSSPTLADRVAGAKVTGKLRAFPGTRGFLRRAVGPGWALVGDAGYFKDPLTAHGITDALRDAELLARAIALGEDVALAEYQTTRDGLVMGLFDVTDRIASFAWDLDEIQQLHLALSKEMNAEVDLLRLVDQASQEAALVR